MNSVYLIHAKTERAKRLIAEEGGVAFSEDVFLHNADPLDIQRMARKEQWLGLDDFTVLDIFVPNKPNRLTGKHQNEGRLKSVLSDLHREAFQWPKENE